MAASLAGELVTDEERLQAALAACIESEGSFKKHARTFGVPASTLRDHWYAHLGKRPPIKADHAPAKAARARAPAPAREAPTAPARTVRGFDPVSATRVERLEEDLRRCHEMMNDAAASRQFAAAKDWNAQAIVVGKQLDEARAADAAESERKRMAQVRDPIQLAQRILAQVPHLVRLAPEEARQIWELLGQKLGRLEDPDAEPYVPPDEVTDDDDEDGTDA